MRHPGFGVQDQAVQESQGESWIAARSPGSSDTAIIQGAGG